MARKDWEKKVLSASGAEERVGEIEGELRLAAGLGVSKPRVVAIERSKNVTLTVLKQYLGTLGMRVEISAVSDESRTILMGTPSGALHEHLRGVEEIPFHCEGCGLRMAVSVKDRPTLFSTRIFRSGNALGRTESLRSLLLIRCIQFLVYRRLPNELYGNLVFQPRRTNDLEAFG